MQTTRYIKINRFIGMYGILLLLTPGLGVAQEERRWEQEQAKLRQLLVSGQDRDFYSAKLTELGYRITAAYIDPYAEEYEVVKDGLNYAVKINVSQEDDKTTRVEIVRDPVLSETTKRILEVHLQTRQIARDVQE